jgi:hypothetical protein
LRVYLVVTALAALVAALGLGLPQDLPSPVLPLGLLLALRSIDVLRDAAPAEVESAS